jgi:hypothetical protein
MGSKSGHFSELKGLERKIMRYREWSCPEGIISIGENKDFFINHLLLDAPYFYAVLKAMQLVGVSTPIIPQEKVLSK